MILFFDNLKTKGIRIMIASIFILLFLNTKSFSQQGIKPESRFIETLHAITDRDLYIAGEDVWLKLTTLNCIDNVPVNLSKIAYVDLLDMENNPVLQFKASIEGYTGSSKFRLPDTISTGNYIIRSYTNWMKNFNEDMFSYKMISVINPFKSLNKISIPQRYVLPDSVTIIPEGGSMVSGVETLTGFRSMKGGSPVKIKGVIIDESNDTAGTLHTDNEGYGWLRIRSFSGRKLSLVCSDYMGRNKKILLPEAHDEGVALVVTGTDENTPDLVNIRCSNEFLKKGRQLFFLAGSPGADYSKTELKLNSENQSTLLKKDLPQGLFNLLIADESNKVWASRWIWNEPQKGICYKINTVRTGAAREKITIEVTASDSNGLPVESDFAISVAKAFAFNQNGFGKKLTQLPELAAMSAGSGKSGLNDYLLFYSPERTLPAPEKSQTVFLPELEGHLISGIIKDRKTGMPLKNTNIILSYVGKKALCQFTSTDEKGDFNFVTNEKGVHEIVIQPLSAALKDCYVELYNPFVTSYVEYNHGLFLIDSTRLDEINNAIIGMQVKKIYDPLTVAKSQALTTDNPDFYGSPDNRINMSTYIELTSLKEVVKEIMPGVTTVRKNDQYNFRLINKYQSSSFENNPLVIVDGVPVNDIEKVLNISSKDIEKIDVLTTRYFISDIVLDGILHFVSKKGDLGVIDFDRSIYRLQYELPKDNNIFLSPDYSADTLKHNHIPDYRNTLYWNPQLHTGTTGKATVEFYSSDESSDYLIQINGFDKDGRTGSAELPITVDSR